MTSYKKLEANRRNSRKSTGPKTPRGKAASRFNALRLGVFAMSRLLPGENKAVYKKIADEFVGECQPEGPIQKLLTDQLLGAYWRLLRLEQAERTYFMEIKASQLRRFFRSLTEEELEYVRRHYRRGAADRRSEDRAEHRPIPEIHRSGSTDEAFVEESPDENMGPGMAGVKRAFRDLFGWDKAILEAIVPPSERSPRVFIDQQRRSAMQELMRNLFALKELQGGRSPGGHLNEATNDGL